MVAQKSEEDGVAYLVAALDLAGVRLGAVDLAALVHVVEALLGARAGLLGVVGVGDGALCGRKSAWTCYSAVAGARLVDAETLYSLRPRAT